MMFDRRTNFALFGFLVFLNILVRFFLMSGHEVGADSFVIHNLANSISAYGNAKWIIHPLSYFGLTPLSYPCAVPYILSGISQLAGVDMEASIMIFSFVTGFIGLGSAYLMAMEIKRDHVFAFVVALIFSLSPVFTELTIWQATTRSLFIALLPLLVWSLMRTFGDKTDKAKDIFISILIFTIAGTIHHMFLLLPLFLIAYFSTLFIYRRIQRRGTKELWINRFQTIILISLFLLFFLPQFSHRGIYSTVSWRKYETGFFFIGTENHILFLNMIVDYWSRTSFFAFLSVFGFILLIYRPTRRISDVLERFKYKRTRNEIFLIICLFITIPFVTMGTYVSLLFLPFFSLVIGLGIYNLYKILKRNRVIVSIFFILLITVTIYFAVFMNLHWDRSITSQPISEHSYSTAVYISENFEGTSITNDGLFSARIGAISGIPALPLGGAYAAYYPPDLLVHDFANVDDYTFKRISFDAVILTQSDNLFTTAFGINANEDWNTIMRKEVNDRELVQRISRYNATQVVEIRAYEDRYLYWSLRPSLFLESLDENKYVIYDNGVHQIWML